MIVLRVCGVATLCVMSARADAAPAEDDVGPTPVAPAAEATEAAEAEGPEAAPAAAATPTRLPGV